MDGELRSLLDYFESLVPQDAFTGELEEAVAVARVHKEWRQEYMKLELMMMDSRREGRAEGETVKLIEQICRKIVKGKTIEEIASELEENTEVVGTVYNVAARFAPDYDREKILMELTGTSGQQEDS